MTDRSDFKPPEPFTFSTPLRIRWAECDAQGVVFNAQYYFLYDVGLTEYSRAVTRAHEQEVEFYTVASSAEFIQSAVFDDLVDVAVRLARIGNTSVRFEMAMFRAGEILSRGQLTYVNVEPGTKSKTPLPEAYVEAVEAFERTPPERA